MATHLTEGGYAFSALARSTSLREKVSINHDLNRLNRYGNNWRIYLGEHWEFKREDGDPLVTVNYAAALVDKKIAFLIGNDFTVTVPKVLEHLTLPLIQQVWEESGRQALNYEIAQEGAVTGDAFLLITVDRPTIEQKLYDPLRQWRIVIQRLNSHECEPTFDESAAPTRYGRPIKKFIIKKEMTRPKLDKPAEYENVPLIIEITNSYISTKIGDAPASVAENVLGEIPVVHIRNKPCSRAMFGLDDMADLIPLNKEFNEKTTDVSDTINYQATPITIVYGAKAKNIQRGPRALWSGLPTDAKVEMLQLQGDLGASNNYLDKVKRALHEIAGVPEGSLGQLQAISGTSGETLAAQMAPLVDERNKKRTMYEPGFERVNYFILRYAQQFLNLTVPKGICRKCGGKIAIFYEPDPTDTVSEAQLKSEGRERRQIERRKCFAIDPDTFDFLDPDQMKIPVMRSHSMGTELTRVNMDQADEESGIKNPSYWDMAPSRAFSPEEIAQMQGGLPSGFQLPPEPETFDLPEVKVVRDDGTEEIVQQEQTSVKAIPQECQEHSFLNPFTNYVSFNDTLPKDKQGQANLLQIYQTLGIVSKLWMMQQIGIENPEDMMAQIRAENAEAQAQMNAANGMPQDQQDTGAPQAPDQSTTEQPSGSPETATAGEPQ